MTRPLRSAATPHAARATSSSPPPAARSSPRWSARPMRRCRSTTGSAAPPATAAPPRSPTSAPAQALDRTIADPLRCQCRRRAALALRARAERRSTVRIGEVDDRLLQGDQPIRARRPRRRRAYNVTPPTVGAYFSKINCFCFTEQTHEAGRDARDGGGVLRRSGASSKDPDQDDAQHHHAVLHLLSGARAGRGRRRSAGATSETL